jgi:hypothetical protein
MTLREYLINNVTLSATSCGDTSLIDGLFIDDHWSSSGPTEMDKYVQVLIVLTCATYYHCVLACLFRRIPV